MQGPEIIGLKASAGSGKTYNLALRYLTLLHHLQTPDKNNLRKIVAITFTNKAAAEMKERILLFLKQIAFNTKQGQILYKATGICPHKAKQWVETIILNYSDFQVRTIDSLLFAILKGLAFELDIKSESDVVFNQEDVFEQAFNVLLKNLTQNKNLWEQALKTYLEIDDQKGFYPEYKLRERLFEIYPQIDDNVNTYQMDLKEFQHAEKELIKTYNKFYSVYNKLKTKLNANLIGKSITATLEPKKIIEKKFLQRNPSELFKKNQGSEKEKKEFEHVFIMLKEKAEIYSSYLSKSAFSKVGGYVAFLKQLRTIIKNICQKEGLILGGEEWTRIILKEMQKQGLPPLIYAHFAAKFSHFLFDEFQDTSRLQWDGLYFLLEDVLSKGGSLFLVGDTKQAIFSWRGGDWTIFEEIFNSKQQFPCVTNKKQQTLTKNYRSHPDLVDFFNTLFEPLTNVNFVQEHIAPYCLGSNSPVQHRQQFAQDITSAFANHKQVPHLSSQTKGIVKIYKLRGNKEELENKVKKVFIEQIKKIWDKQGQTQETPIAILVRKHEEAATIASWLFAENIPVITEQGLKLKVSNIVKGLLCFLYYLYDQNDEIALYGFLASNLYPDTPKDETELLQTWTSDQIDYWKTKINNLAKKLKPYLNRRSPYELLWAIMDNLSLSTRLQKELVSHKVFVEKLLEVTHEFEVKQGPSLAKYLEFLEQGGLEQRISLPENIQAIQILTIHKAKGLEFPIVFIPFTDWRIQTKPQIAKYNNYLVYLGKHLSDELTDFKFQRTAKEAQELLNLFYVAITRAKQELYLFLTCPSTKQGRQPLSVWIEKMIDKTNQLKHVEITNI
ncbi:MAG: UvrD-helicase domain-containing protein [Desulfonauticus sp.]|nr:UvrD-helicase domain-containing protein [Desulfonauticus sp.]